jgi:spore coat polysaccharide biosynthesis protein SpsF
MGGAMMKPAVAVIQARMSSSRLPGKVLMPLAGRPMIWHIVERARACRSVDEVIVATSSEASDDRLADFCAAHGIACHRGSLEDVLGRYLEVLRDRPQWYCVRVTGDCPMIDPVFIDRQVAALAAHDGDMIWIDGPAPLLEGQGVHSVRSLLLVDERSNHSDDREHVGSRYFAEHPEEFRVVGLNLSKELYDARWRLTIDEREDYELMAKLYAALWRGTPIPLGDAVDWLERNPESASLNRDVEHRPLNQELTRKRAAWGDAVKFCVESEALDRL